MYIYSGGSGHNTVTNLSLRQRCDVIIHLSQISWQYTTVLHLDYYKIQICCVALHQVYQIDKYSQLCADWTLEQKHTNTGTQTPDTANTILTARCVQVIRVRRKKVLEGGVGGCGQPERETQRVREKTQRAERERDSHITSIFSWNVSVCGFNYALCRLTTKTWKLSRWIYKSTLVRLAGTAELSCVGYEEHTDSDTWAAFRESAR